MNDEFSEPLQQVEKVFVLTPRGKLLYFGGCDYFRLSTDPRIIAALHQGADRYGISTSASRKTTGNHALYEELEKEAAAYFGAECAVALSSGYLSNFALAQALRGEIDHLFIDERSHGSLLDAATLTGATITLFRHRDPLDLQNRIAAAQGRIAVATDGVFAFNGSLAPLAAYREQLAAEVLLWVDDAHGVGVLGQSSLDRSGITWHNVALTATFSKAFGTYGGAVLCDRKMRAALIARSSAVSGNTPLPLPLVNASLTALRTLDSSLQLRLTKNIETFWGELQKSPPQLSPIVSFVTDEPQRLSTRLLQDKIYPSFIHYPGGPAAGYFRFALSSEHTPQQVRALATAIRETPGVSSLLSR